MRVTANPGESFMDRMIGLVEGAKRQKTPNELALSVLLSALTIVFLFVVLTLKPFGRYFGIDSISVPIALLERLAPTTIGGLLSAIGIAGIDRIAFALVVALLVKPAGIYLERVFAGERTWLDPVLRPLERAVYRLARVQPAAEMSWPQYAASLIAFNLAGALFLYAILRLQQFLPEPPDAAELKTPMTLDLAMNTAISFFTATSWQAYGGGSTLKYASQILGVTAQNFVAGASGLAVGVAFIRSFARQKTTSLGNFWVDVTRATLWILLPSRCSEVCCSSGRACR